MADEDAGLLGRELEQEVLRRCLAGLDLRQGGVLLLIGEAGVGKSRLLEHLAAEARAADRLVLTGRAVEGCGPHRPLAEALAGHLRDHRLDLDGELRPYRAALARLLPDAGPDVQPPGPAVDPVLVLGEGLLRLAAALSGPRGCVLALEDLHWADAETLALLEYLVGAARQVPVLVVGSLRDDEALSAPLLRVLGRNDVIRLPVRRLAPAEAAALAVRRAGRERLPAPVLTSVVQRADGLPLLVEELVAAALDPALGPDPVPPSLAARVRGRLDGLTDDERLVLEAAAVLGPEPDWDLLAQVADRAPALVTRALRRVTSDLLVLHDGRLGWRHALTRDAVLATVLPPDRARLATRAADLVLLGGRPDARRQAAELLLATGPAGGAAAAPLLLEQARIDLAHGTLHTAEATLDRAAAAGASAPAVAAARVRLATLRGEPRIALRHGEALLAEVHGDAHAELRLQLAAAAVAAGQWQRALDHAVAAGRPGDPRVLVLTADAAFGRGDVAAARAAADAAVASAERDGPPDQLCAALSAVGRCASRSDPAEASSAFRRAADLAAAHGLLPERVAALLMVGTLDLLTGPGSAALGQARSLALDAGLLAAALSADLLLLDGHLAAEGPVAIAAEAAALASRAQQLDLPAVQAVAELYVAGAAAWAGDESAARRILTAAADRPAASVEAIALAPAVLALGRVAAHDLTGALALLEQSLPALARHGSAAPVQFWGLWALLRTVLGEAGHEARDALRRSPARMRTLNSGALHLADAVAAGRAGRDGEMRALLAAGRSDLDGQGWWAGVLELLVLEAAVHGDWLDPVPGLRAELARHEQTGEAPLVRTCRDLLRSCGAPVRRGPGSSAVPPHLARLGITGREADVLALVVRGLSNREVAEALVLSPRTVDTHVTRLLAKTGAVDRRDLGRRTSGTT